MLKIRTESVSGVFGLVNSAFITIGIIIVPLALIVIKKKSNNEKMLKTFKSQLNILFEGFKSCKGITYY